MSTSRSRRLSAARRAAAGLDRSAGKPLRAGGFVYLPQDMPHALWTTTEPVELQVNGTGPFGLNYIDPADDPSRTAQGPR